MSGASGNGHTVLVVGAGPTGLVLALCLARAGVAVRVVDRSARPAATSRAIGIQARTLELLDLFGLAEKLVALGLRAVAGNIYSGGRRLVHLNLAPLESRFPYILLLEQPETERILTQALIELGVMVERGVELVSFTHDPTGVDVRLSKDEGEPTSTRYDYMVGCDGAHSITRHGLDVGFAGKTLHQKFLLADLDIQWRLPDDQFHIFTSPDGLMAIFPMRHGHRLIAATREEPTVSDSEPSMPQLDAVARRAAVEMKLSNLRWSSFFRVNSRLATRLRDGRVLLAGDAAHIHSPAGAQGMNTGIQDAINLGWKLALVLRGQASPDLIETYEAERYPVERSVLRQTEVLTRIVSLKGRFPRFLRDLAMPAITGIDMVQKAARQMISEVGISYKVQQPRLRGLEGGHRMPDLLVELQRGRRSQRLYELLDPTRFTLLVISLETAGHAGTSIDTGVEPELVTIIHAHRLADDDRSTTAERFFLIRPDAYVVLQGPLPKLADALAWLRDHVRGSTAIQTD